MSLIKLKNNALDNLTSFEGSASLGDMVFISSATASSSASIEFTLGDYKEYKFFFVNLHPSASGNPNFEFNLSSDNGSNYNVTKTTTSFGAIHNESGSTANLNYDTAADLAQGTGYQIITTDGGVGNLSDECLSGTLQLFNPASSVYVKHFISNINNYHDNSFSINSYIAGYANTVSPLTNIIFRMSSGNIDDGKILLFGIN